MRISDWSSDFCFSDLLYSTKDVKAESTYSYRPPDIFHVRQSTDTKQWGLNAGLRLDLPGEWRGEVTATMSANNEDYLELHSVYEPYIVFFDNRLRGVERSEEHTSELQSLMSISYAVFCLNKKNKSKDNNMYKNTN